MKIVFQLSSVYFFLKCCMYTGIDREAHCVCEKPTENISMLLPLVISLVK